MCGSEAAVYLLLLYQHEVLGLPVWFRYLKPVLNNLPLSTSSPFRRHLPQGTHCVACGRIGRWAVQIQPWSSSGVAGHSPARPPNPPLVFTTLSGPSQQICRYLQHVLPLVGKFPARLELRLERWTRSPTVPVQAQLLAMGSAAMGPAPSHLIPSHPPSAICHLPSAICHLPSAICHLPYAILQHRTAPDQTRQEHSRAEQSRPYHTTPYRTTPHQPIPYHTAPYRTTRYGTAPYRTRTGKYRTVLYCSVL